MSGWRRHILKAVLWSLAVAAAAGVVGVMVTSSVIWRVAETGFVTAVAAALMLPLLRLGDRRRMQAAAVAGTAAVAVEFLLFLMMIWDAPRLVAGPFNEWRFLLTAFLIAATGGAGMVFLWLLHAPGGRWAGRVGIAQAVAFLVLSLFATWAAPQQWTGLTEDLWWSALGLAMFGLLAAAALVGAGTDRHHWRWVGVAASAAGLLSLSCELWLDTLFDEKLFGTLIAVACWVAFANLAVRVPVKGAQWRLRAATLAAGAATALGSVLVVFGLDAEFMLRVIGAAAILTACGTLSLGVLARLNRRGDLEGAPPELALITLFCPRCRKKQTVELGGGRCGACNLRIDVRVEEPRCAECGYLLYALTGDRCPECGTAVAGPPAAAA